MMPSLDGLAFRMKRNRPAVCLNIGRAITELQPWPRLASKFTD
ncbi:hypothetical protein [Deefgea rivuli]|nr:hypothetical protein [Deefgea rivuli]